MNFVNKVSYSSYVKFYKVSFHHCSNFHNFHSSVLWKTPISCFHSTISTSKDTDTTSSKIVQKEPESKAKSNSSADLKRVKTPIGKLDELQEGKHPYQEKEPLPPWPDNTNPNTGEIGGPRGPEPTRYGDWERKGRVSDF